MKKRRKKSAHGLPAKGRLREIADTLWSLAVRADHGGRCIVCGSTKPQAHHLIPRGHQATRYSLRNGVALCATHHMWDAYIAPHLNAAGWLLWLKEHHPLRYDWYIDMTESGEYRQFDQSLNTNYYLDVIESLQEYVTEDEFLRTCGPTLIQRLELRRAEQ